MNFRIRPCIIAVSAMYFSVSAYSFSNTEQSLHGQFDPSQCESNDQICIKNTLSRYADSGKRVLSYSEARTEMFQRVDGYKIAKAGKEVACVYSDAVFAVGNRIPDANQVNTEHTWPQSELKQYPRTYAEARTDLFHLFPTTSSWNSLRGHLPFADIPGEPEGDRVSETDGTSYEVPEFHKGEVARAMFYMSIKYDMPIDAAQEKTFHDWATKYPVTQEESARASRVTLAQGNSNPFIDHPEWIALVSDF